MRDEEIDNQGVRCRPQSRCVRCGGEGAPLHADIRDHIFGAPGVWSLRQCVARECGIAWLDPQPLAEDIGKLYASYHTHDVQQADAADDDGMANAELVYGLRYSRWRRALGAIVPPLNFRLNSGLGFLSDLEPGKLLDVGCGSGAFLAVAARHGWEAHGIDFDPQAVAAANRRPGVTAHVGDLAGLDPALAPFDAITLDNVIEHLPDPEQVFDQCYALLRPGGRLVMQTPNIESEGHRIFGPDWRGLEVPRHLQVFTARALRGSARRAGFARAELISLSAGEGPSFFISASRHIATQSGRVPPDARARAMKIATWLGMLAGKQRGEALVLIAHR